MSRSDSVIPQQMEEWFAIFNAIEGAVYVADMETYEVLAVAGRSGSRDPSGLVGRKCYECFQGGRQAPCPFCTNHLLVGPDGRPNRPVVWEFQNPRSQAWYLCIDRAIPWPPDGRLVRMEIAIDISERKRAEDALTRSEQNFRELVENSLVGILLIQDGEIIYQNPEQRRLFGVLPRSFNLETFPGIHPDDAVKVRESYRKISGGLSAQVDLDFRFYPGGRQRPENMKWVYCRARPINYQGRKTMLISMVDIGQSKELERLIRVQDKMSSLGRVAAGIAHEIRNPLSGLNIYLDTLEKIYRQPEQAERAGEIFRQLRVASGKIEAVIRRVIDFARPGQPNFKEDDLNRPVEAALGLVAAFLRRAGVKVEQSLAPALPPVALDAHLIEQVLVNLLTNSAEAMQGQEGPRLIRVGSRRAGDWVEAWVEDNGPGVEAAVRDKIFDPFFTTKPDGTGIGLNISHRIINDHRGELRVAESPLGGARFSISLPVAKKE